MAVPGQPTTLSTVADAMNQAVITLNATSVSTVVLNNAAAFLENVKSQLWMASTHDRLLDTTSVLLTTAGGSTVTLPADFDHDTEFRLFDGPDANRGTLQAATSTAVQLASDFSQDPSTLLGTFFFTLSGTGSGQEASVATYSDTTKWATMTGAFSTTPDSTTTYLLASYWQRLERYESDWGVQYSGRPLRYRLVSTTTYVSPPADQIYPIRLYYGANLTRLDENGGVFAKHLRERRYYWIQGLKVETMGLFDDDRYDTESAKWAAVLANYGGKNPVYAQTSFAR